MFCNAVRHSVATQYGTRVVVCCNTLQCCRPASADGLGVACMFLLRRKPGPLPYPWTLDPPDALGCELWTLSKTLPLAMCYCAQVQPGAALCCNGLHCVATRRTALQRAALCCNEAYGRALAQVLVLPAVNPDGFVHSYGRARPQHRDARGTATVPRSAARRAPCAPSTPSHRSFTLINSRGSRSGRSTS